VSPSIRRVLVAVSAVGGTRDHNGQFVPDRDPIPRIDTTLRNRATYDYQATHHLQPDYRSLSIAAQMPIFADAYRCPPAVSSAAPSDSPR
jgi:hypothetical protein